LSAKKRLTRAERKQIEAAIARANRTDKKEKSAQDSIPYKRMIHMKLIIKILLSPIVLTIDLLTWIFVGLISCSSILFHLASSIIALLGVAVLVTYSVKNGLILLTIAFLFSPMGLPMIAVSVLSGLQSISATIKNL